WMDTRMVNRRKRLVTALPLLLAAALPCAAGSQDAGPVRERVLSSFEGETPLAGWHASGDVRLAPSRVRASRGGDSRESVDGPRDSRMQLVDIVRAVPAGGRDCAAVEVDLYNAVRGPGPLRVILHRGGLPSLYAHHKTVPRGRWH